jgi:MinD superfamily P-loop ATPase
VINKADLSEEVSRKIEAFAASQELPHLGRIPYDREVTERMVAGRSAVEGETSLAGAAMREIFARFTEAFRDRR